MSDYWKKLRAHPGVPIATAFPLFGLVYVILVAPQIFRRPEWASVAPVI